VTCFTFGKTEHLAGQIWQDRRRLADLRAKRRVADLRRRRGNPIDFQPVNPSKV
jgi:hypothetical protein